MRPSPSKTLLEQIVRRGSDAGVVVHRRGDVDVLQRRASRGTIMWTFVVIACAPNWKVLTGRERGPQPLDLLARAEEERAARADRRAHRLHARPRCGRSTCRTSSSARTRSFIFGTPNGQASTQLLQAMQRGFRARLHDAVAGPLDRVGRADLGAGRRVAVHADDRHRLRRDRRGRTYSRWIIECPLCVSHSLQACDARLAADAAVRVDEELVVGSGTMATSSAGLLAAARAGRRTPAAVGLADAARRRPCTRGSSRSGPAPRSSAGWRSCAPPSGTG